MTSRRDDRAALRVPLRQLLTDPLPRVALERVRRRVHESRRASHRPVSGRTWAAGGVIAVAVAIALLAAWRARGANDVGPLRVVDGAVFGSVYAGSSAVRVALHEGSRIALSPGSRLDAVENDSDHVLLTQGDGAITYDVQPHGPRRWTIDAGAVAVDVIGTRFSIVRRGARVRVSVARGQVRVRGVVVEGGLRSLSAGEVLEVGAPRRVEESEASVPRGEGPAPQHREAGSASAATTAARGAAPPTSATSAQRWLVLAARGEHRHAFDALGMDGFERTAARSGSVNELFALADTARLSGHAALAVAPLERVLAEHASDPRAGLAALTLGRLQLDALDAPGTACASLERAIALGLPPDLAEIAYARLVEAHRRAGHREQMEASARAYLERFRSGRNAERIRQLVPDVPE